MPPGGGGWICISPVLSRGRAEFGGGLGADVGAACRAGGRVRSFVMLYDGTNPVLDCCAVWIAPGCGACSCGAA